MVSVKMLGDDLGDNIELVIFNLNLFLFIINNDQRG